MSNWLDKLIKYIFIIYILVITSWIYYFGTTVWSSSSTSSWIERPENFRRPRYAVANRALYINHLIEASIGIEHDEREKNKSFSLPKLTFPDLGSDNLSYFACSAIGDGALLSNFPDFGKEPLEPRTVPATCREIRRYLRSFNKDLGLSQPRLAFIIGLSEPEVLGLHLLRVLYDSTDLYCIYPSSRHAKRSSWLKLSKCLKNVIFLEKYQPTGHLQWDIANQQLSCIDLLLRSSWPWSHAVSLNDAEIPLRNLSLMKEYVRDLGHHSIVPGFISTSRTFQRRFGFIHVMRQGRLVRTDQRNDAPPHNITIYRGDVEFVATREFASFALKSNVSHDFLAWTRWTMRPTEIFWPSLYRYFLDNLLADRVSTEIDGVDVNELDRSIFDELVSVMWHDGDVACSGRYEQQRCVLSAGELGWVLERQSLFVKPVRTPQSDALVKCLEVHLRYPLALLEKD